MKAMERDRQRGAVAAEVALMLPFLLILVVSVMDLGLMVRQRQILENAAREGARYSARPENWVAPQNPSATMADIQDHVVEYCSQAGVSIAPASIAIDQNYTITSGTRSFRASRVVVSDTWTPLTPLGSTLTGGPATLTGEAVFRNFY